MSTEKLRDCLEEVNDLLSDIEWLERHACSVTFNRGYREYPKVKVVVGIHIAGGDTLSEAIKDAIYKSRPPMRK